MIRRFLNNILKFNIQRRKKFLPCPILFRLQHIYTNLMVINLNASIHFGIKAIYIFCVLVLMVNHLPLLVTIIALNYGKYSGEKLQNFSIVSNVPDLSIMRYLAPKVNILYLPQPIPYICTIILQIQMPIACICAIILQIQSH